MNWLLNTPEQHSKFPKYQAPYTNDTPYVFMYNRCTWGPSLTTTQPKMTSSHAKKPALSFKPVTSFRSSTSRIPTGGRAEWRATLPTLQDLSPPQSSRSGKAAPSPTAIVSSRLVAAQDAHALTRTSFCIVGGWQAKARPERAASPAAPLGRRRSAKTSTWPSTAPVSVFARMTRWFHPTEPLLDKQALFYLQFLTSWTWYPTRRWLNCLLLKGKHLCL